MSVQLFCGDCLEVMPTLPDHSIDAIIADLPYGTTACSWDVVIPFAPLWVEYKRLIKRNGAIVLFGSQPFTSLLVTSNLEWFRYEWAWDKVTPTGFLNCQKAPLKSHESIVVFYQEQSVYNPQKIKKPYKGSRTGAGFTQEGQAIKNGVYGSLVHGSGYRSEYSYPKSVLEFPTGNGHTKSNYGHPTQKPVSLMQYLIRTYTNEGETVLDNTMGSGTTLVACVNTGRNGIGIELREDYFAIAQRRIADAQAQLALPFDMPVSVQLGIEG